MAGVIDFRSYVRLPGSMAAMTSLPPELDRYAEKYHVSTTKALAMGPNDLVALLDACGIDHMVLAGSTVSHDEMAEYVSTRPDRLSGIASVSPSTGISSAVQDIRRSYSLGLRLVGLSPFRDGCRASDRQYYPIYSTCAELGMAVVIHTSFNFGRGMKLDFGRPLHLDEVATDFPELIIVASHGGWPWVQDMVAVAWHHENIYIELSGQRAKHMANEGSGWASLFNYGSGPLRSRLLWGSGSPALDLEQQLSEAQELPFRKEALSMMLDVNPRELLTKIGVKVGACNRFA